jgi:hypothetical protein
MSDTPFAAQIALSRYALIAGPVRGLDLQKRVPELMRRRRWPHEDPDLVCVIAVAVGLKKIGAGLTLIRRPPAAAGLGGLWPAEDGKMEARQLVERLELTELLQNR